LTLFEFKKFLSLFTQVIPAGIIFIIFLSALSLKRCRVIGGLILLVAVSLLALSSPVVSRHLVATLELNFPALATPPENSRYIAVFSGGAHRKVDRDPPISLSPEQSARLIEAVRLWKLSPESTLITTGAHFRRESSSAEAMAVVARWFGVPESQIVRLDTARDTKEEIEQLSELVAAEPIVIVASASHLPRIAMLASRANLNATFAPSHWKSSTFSWWRFNSERLYHVDQIIHEYVGMWWYRLTLGDS